MNQLRRVGRFPWLNAIMSNTCTLSPTARLVTAGLFQFMEREGSGAFPSQHTLAGATGLARSTIQTALAELERSGYVLKREVGRGRGGFPKHAYEATLPADAIAPARGPITRTAGAANGPAAGQNDCRERDGDLTDSPPRFDRSAAANGPAAGHDPSDPSLNPDSAGPHARPDPSTECERSGPSPEDRARLDVVRRLTKHLDVTPESRDP